MERGWDRRQMRERLLLFPTGGGVGQEVGSPADWRETTAAPHGWGSGRSDGIHGSLPYAYFPHLISSTLAPPKGVGGDSGSAGTTGPFARLLHAHLGICCIAREPPSLHRDCLGPRLDLNKAII